MVGCAYLTRPTMRARMEYDETKENSLGDRLAGTEQTRRLTT